MISDDPLIPQDTVPEAPVGECLGPDGKALRKTFGEVREDARRDILSAADREKFEELDPDQREYVDQVCLFESKSQESAARP